MLIFGLGLSREARSVKLREKYFFSSGIKDVRFGRGAPERSYYLPEIGAYLFDGHKNFALAHALEIYNGTVPPIGNILLLFDQHMDYMARNRRPGISIPAAVSRWTLGKIERHMRKNLINEVTFSCPFLDNRNIYAQIDVFPPEKKPRVRNTPLPADYFEVYSPQEADALLKGMTYPGKLVVSIDMDYYYIPAFKQNGWRLSDIKERIDDTIKLLMELKGAGHNIAYISVATTTFNVKDGNPKKFEAIELSTRYLLDQLRLL